MEGSKNWTGLGGNRIVSTSDIWWVNVASISIANFWVGDVGSDEVGLDGGGGPLLFSESLLYLFFEVEEKTLFIWLNLYLFENLHDIHEKEEFQIQMLAGNRFKFCVGTSSQINTTWTVHF